MRGFIGECYGSNPRNALYGADAGKEVYLFEDEGKWFVEG